MLDGSAAAFKGGRDYVHGSDIATFAVGTATETPGLAALRRIEFHRPLVSRGVLFAEPQLAKGASAEFCATGSFSMGDGGELPFAIFPAPLPVLRTDLPFDEGALWPQCEVDAGAQSVRTQQIHTLTFEEHLTSMMKLLCRTVAPTFGKWWFVRLTRNGETPPAGTELELRVRRLTADRFVAASILAGGKPWGGIEFIGRQE
ncbi:hypothetical protein [Maricaulis sp.]|uniref:hypothetical protein n=1 Tax=Maricaulis sp. TaxID=1486257 RepID=UPI00262CB88C|nr:hypothetical protein [Maricaulis sp.]